MNKGLILTGTAGFIGINLLLEMNVNFLKKFDVVYSIDKLGYASVYNKEIYEEICAGHNIKKIDCNIKDLSSVMKFSKEYEWIVINLASNSHVDNSIKTPCTLYEENVIIPSSLLNAFDDIKSIKRFYQISTDEVYGDLPFNSREKFWFSPDSPLHPNNPYSASKAAQDCFLQSMKHTFGLPVSIIRMANQFGNFQHPEKMFPISCLRAFKGETIKVYGNGHNMRQWTPVLVTVQIILEKVEKEEQFDILHIAKKGGLLSNLELAKIMSRTIYAATGIESNIEFVEDRKGHDQMYALKTTKEIDAYFNDISIDQVITNTCEFYYMKRDDFV